MADTQDASIGWGGELKIADEVGALTEILKVQSLKPPTNNRSRQDATHLKSPGKRPESIPGLFEDSAVTATILHRPGSDTADLLFDASEDGEKRAVEMSMPLNGVLIETYSFDAYVSYEVDDVEPNTPMTGTLTLNITGGVTKAPWAAE